MAEPIPLDKAAAAVGKSEVTVRRLIKANKIPFQKERTLTGFIYVVDPDVLRAYYQVRDGQISEELAEEFGAPEAPLTEPSYMPRQPDPVRIAVASESGQPHEYWQKRSELYEDKYNDEVRKHAQAREELGTWRGRAEQAQSMLIKLLPPPEAAQTLPSGAVQPASPSAKNNAEMAWPTVALIIFLVVLLCAAGAGIFYVKFVAGH